MIDKAKPKIDGCVYFLNSGTMNCPQVALAQSIKPFISAYFGPQIHNNVASLPVLHVTKNHVFTSGIQLLV